MTRRDALTEDQTTVRRLGRRVMRHVEWARSQGLARLVEEDQLNPLVRASNRARKWRWRRLHGAPGQARPVYLVGVQRSGTNMIVRGLEALPELEVHNENDRRVFSRYRLRSDDVVRSVIAASPHRFVLFKPLADSHRVDELLGIESPRPALAIWAYRPVDGRVRSALAKFGDANLRVLREVASGEGAERWQAQRLSEQSMELVRSFDYDRMSPATAAALFWCVRNALYFDLGLHERDDVTLVSYRSLVERPEATMRPLCSFLGLAFDPRLVAHIAARASAGAAPLELDPVVRRACEDLQDRLDHAADEKSLGHSPE